MLQLDCGSLETGINLYQEKSIETEEVVEAKSRPSSRVGEDEKKAS
jgi:hypothetical protein